MADAVALLVAIYVFHRGSETPFFAGKVPGVASGFDSFRDVVVDKVAAGSYFSQYDRSQLGSGKLFVVEKRPEDEPVCPTGRGINGETTDQVELPPGHCIILDIRSCVPAADLAAEFRAFRLETTTKLDTVIKQSKEISGVFSGASQTDAMNFARDENIRQGGRLELPALALGAVSPVPYTWGGRSETQASRTLRDSLQAWTCEGASPFINVCFLNTENLTRAPLVAAHEGATYTGVPDLVTLLPGLGVDTVTVFQSASSSWDWKTEKKFTEKRSSVAGQAVLQLLAFSRLATDGCTIPVFFTDMSTGVRCWIMVDKVIYTFHGDGGGPNDLSLERGILLLRYFIANNGRLSAADKARLVPQSASGSGGAAGGGVGSSAASGSGPSDKPEGGAPLGPAHDPAGGSGSAAGAGKTRSATLAVSQQSSPDDPAVLRAEHMAMFELELVVAASTLRACCVDLSGVVDF